MNGNSVQSKIMVNQRVMPWVIWFSVASFYLYQFIVRVSPSVMAQDLMRELSIQACSVGTLASFYYYGYTGMQIPVGITLDHYGVRLPLTLAALICAVGCTIFALADNIALMSFGRLLIGMGSAFGFISCVKIGSMWFPTDRLAFVIGMSMLLGTTGATGGGAPLSMVVSQLHWRGATLLLGGMGLAIALIVFWIVRDHKESLVKLQKVHQVEHNKQTAILQIIRSILKNPQTYIFGLYGGLMYVPLSGFADLWGVPYICTAYGVDRTDAAGAVSALYIGIGAGAPICSWCSDFLRSHKRLMIIGGFLLACIMSMIIYLPFIPFFFTYGLFFLAGVCASTQFIAFAGVCEINPKYASATASGIHNMMCMVSGVIFQPVIGYLLDISSGGALQSDGTPLFTVANYYFALAIVPFSVLLSGFLGFWMKETYKKG